MVCRPASPALPFSILKELTNAKKIVFSDAVATLLDLWMAATNHPPYFLTNEVRRTTMSALGQKWEDSRRAEIFRFTAISGP
jgi:hypothetical protein